MAATATDRGPYTVAEVARMARIDRGRIARLCDLGIMRTCAVNRVILKRRLISHEEYERCQRMVFHRMGDLIAEAERRAAESTGRAGK